MKTNVPITIDDEGLEILANRIDGKVTKRRATRKEIVAICAQHIEGLIEATLDAEEGAPEPREVSENPLYQIAPGDRALMAQPDNPSYVYGWNKAKSGRAYK